jgi:hypothetical protein
MAGSFGYESGQRYEVSIAAGERVILPEVRAASRDTLVLADGFSCRSQIEQRTSRRALHLAEVLALALRDGVRGPVPGPPERAWRVPPPRADRGLAAVAAVSGTALAGLLVARTRHRR